MMLFLLLVALAVFFTAVLLKKIFSKLPGPIALLLFNEKVILANRAYKRAMANPSFSHQRTARVLGRWLFLGTYETSRTDAQGEFIASVCHELKTPLTIIKGFSEMMISLENPSATVLESAMNKIFHASLRMEKTIQNLTILEELEHLPSKKKIACNIQHLLETIKGQLLQVYPTAEIEIDMHVESDFTLEANPGLLEVALSNLIGNALKYSKENDAYAKVEVDLGNEEEENLIIHVKDRGIGIAQNELPKIFDRFYRSYDPKAQKRKGSGLGLAIAKKIIEGHGGTIDVNSSPEVGTEFILALPLTCPLVGIPI